MFAAAVFGAQRPVELEAMFPEEGEMQQKVVGGIEHQTNYISTY
jgi:hypothetical protein